MRGRVLTATRTTFGGLFYDYLAPIEPKLSDAP